MAGRLAGADFLLRHLQRAQAVPAAERTPEVSAFVESVQLLREVCHLLPLTADAERPAAPNTPPQRQRVLQAMLQDARAHYICPALPICDRDHVLHLGKYLSYLHRELSGPPTGRVLRPDEFSHLENAAVMHALLSSNACDAAMLRLAIKTLMQLAHPAAEHAMQQELAELASSLGRPPPLQPSQLTHALLCAFLRVATYELQTANASGGGQQRLPPRVAAGGRHGGPAGVAADGVPDLRTAVERAIHTLLALEPHNPKSHGVAAKAALMGLGQPERATQLGRRALQLAEQQGSDYWAVVGAAHAMIVPAADTWEATCAACQRMQPAIQRCKKLLPELWTVELGFFARSVQAAMANSPANFPATSPMPVPGSQDGGGASGSGASARSPPQRPLAEPALPAGEAQARAILAGLDPMRCSGCGRCALGVRRCSRCRRAQYCSKECQAAHWRTHKTDCHPAAA